jgi:hypothetical protein
MADQPKIPVIGEAEFSALRAEILQRAQFQQQLVNLSVITAGTLLTLFFQYKGPSWLLLIYPILAVFVALEWSFNNSRIFQIGRYIRQEIEDKWAGPGWENHLRSPASRTSVSWLSGTKLAYGTFAVLPLIVLVLGLLNRFDWSRSKVVLASCDAVVSAVLIPLLIHYSER